MLQLIKQMVLRFISKCCGFYHYLLFITKRLFFGKKRLLESTSYSLYHSLIDLSIRKFLKTKNSIENQVANNIKRKRIVKIGFVVYTSAMWFFDELYILLEKHERFVPQIVIGHFPMSDYASSDAEYQSCLRYFKNKGFSVLPIEEVHSLDALFYLTPFRLYEKELNLNNVKLSQLIYHASYSYMLVGNTAKLALNMYHWSFRYYTDSQYYLDQLSKTKQYSGNGRYFGYPKMDQFYSTLCDRLSNKKTIIYAPHHSVDYTEFKSATFEQNYRFILELMWKYKDDVYWIYKPHPLLRDKCIKAHIFNSFQDYDAYLDEMVSTGCVKIADSGDYFGLFKASDAMITDSVSFLAEYQFTGKPLLLLKSGQEQYNEFGQRIVDILYSCPGDDFNSIESFVKKTICGDDPMKKTRSTFFKDNLDYVGSSGDSANQRIFNDLIDVLG